MPRREPGKHPATRSFQAIRIIINRELEDIHSVLSQVPDILAEQGRLVAISFQSLEDRIVKRALRRMAEGDPLPPDLPVFAAQTGGNMQVIGRARKADDAEIKQNPRARSAVLRVAERLS